jgi:ATP-binding protein involved in chromosome partitioning
VTEKQNELSPSNQDASAIENLATIKHRIVVFSGKGGVGKTTVSVNLAYALKALGFNSAILDADITGHNVPKMLGVNERTPISKGRFQPHEHEGVKIISTASLISNTQAVIWRGPRRSKLLKQFLRDVEWGELDYLIVDLPPGTGDEVITSVENIKPDLALVVTTPQDLALLDSGRAIDMAKRMQIPHIGLIENMSGMICPECHKLIDVFGMGGGNRQALEHEIIFMGDVPMDIGTRVLADEGMPVVLACPDKKVSRIFKYLARKIHAMLDISSDLWLDNQSSIVDRELHV